MTSPEPSGMSMAGENSLSHRDGGPPGGPSFAFGWNAFLEPPQNVFDVTQGTTFAPAPCTLSQPGGRPPEGAVSKFSDNRVVSNRVPVVSVCRRVEAPVLVATLRV